MNLTGFWCREEQTRVGERERKVFQEEKNVAGKVNRIAKMIVRTVAFEALQPIVAEAFMKEQDNNQCGLDEVEETNGN